MLDNPGLMLIVLVLTIALNVLIVVRIPKGFFPQQDTGVIMGAVQGPQDASFPFMNFSTLSLVNVVKADPAVAHVNAYTGKRQRRLHVHRAQAAGSLLQGRPEAATCARLRRWTSSTACGPR